MAVADLFSRLSGRRNVCQATLAIVLTLALPLPDLLAQTGFLPGDVVTFADSRQVYSVDYTTREVVFSTNGGLWRLDRQTLEPLDPEFAGIGRGASSSLRGAKAILHHQGTGSLWTWSDGGLLVREKGIDKWREVGDFGPADGKIGVRNDTIFVLKGEVLFGVEIFGFRDLGTLSVGREGIRWSGERQAGDERPFYHIDDRNLRYERSDGSLVDWDLKKYKPGFSLEDPDYNRTYICYPGLGLGIVNERIGKLEIFQPGPAGEGVRAITFGDDGKIYVGGDSKRQGDGLNVFDRETGRWERFGRRDRWGFDTEQFFDLLYFQGRIFVATEDGLLVGTRDGTFWNKYGLLESAPLPPLWLVEVLNDNIFLGGRGGIKRMRAPSGPFFKVNGPRQDEVYASDGVTDGDTIWLAGLHGLFRGTKEGELEYFGGEKVIGEEASRAVAVSSEFVAVGGISGVRLFDRKTGEWRALLSKVYLQGGQVVSLAARQELIWVGTTNGLYQYNDHTGETIPFGINEGLPVKQVDKLALEADTLWVGTRAGLTRFNLNAGYWK